jgi:hypothetical protein
MIGGGIFSGEYPIEGLYRDEPLNIWCISEPLVFAGAMQPRLRKYMPRGYIERSIAESSWGCDKLWEGRNGSTIRFISWDKDPDSIEGPEIDVAIFDEPPPLKIQSGVRSRLRGKVRREYYFFTPLGASSHLREEFEGADKSNTALYNMPIWLNCACLAGVDRETLVRLGANPLLALEAHPDGCMCNGGWKSRIEILAYLGQFHGAERLAREWGEWLFTHRRIFPGFRRETHVIRRDECWNMWGGRYPKEGSLYVALDPHGARPDCLQIWCILPDGTHVCLIDLPSFYVGKWKGQRYHTIRGGQHTEETCSSLITALRLINLPVEDMVADPRAGAVTPKDASQNTVGLFNESLSKLGWTGRRFRLVSPDKDDIGSIESGERRINDRMETLNRLTGRPMELYHEDCENSIYANENYRTEKDSNADGKSKAERPEEEFKDYPDCDRYKDMARPRFVEREDFRKRGRQDEFVRPSVATETREINYAW